MLKRIDSGLIQGIQAISNAQSLREGAIKLAAFMGAAGLLIAAASLIVPDTVMLTRSRGADIPMDWALWITSAVVCLFAARAFQIRDKIDA